MSITPVMVESAPMRFVWTNEKGMPFLRSLNRKGSANAEATFVFERELLPEFAGDQLHGLMFGRAPDAGMFGQVVDAVSLP